MDKRVLIFFETKALLQGIALFSYFLIFKFLNIAFVNIYLDYTVLLQVLIKDIVSYMRTGYYSYLHNYYN